MFLLKFLRINKGVLGNAWVIVSNAFHRESKGKFNIKNSDTRWHWRPGIILTNFFVKSLSRTLTHLNVRLQCFLVLYRSTMEQWSEGSIDMRDHPFNAYTNLCINMQEVRNLSFLDNFVYLLNGLSLKHFNPF